MCNLDLRDIDFSVLDMRKKLTALLLSSSERIQVLFCICIRMARSCSSCCLMAGAVRELRVPVLQVWDGGHKANVEVVQGKTVKQNWEFSVVLISKHL